MCNYIFKLKDPTITNLTQPLYISNSPILLPQAIISVTSLQKYIQMSFINLANFSNWAMQT